MAQPEQKLTTPTSLAIDAVLTVAVFLFFFKILQSHVPATQLKWIYIWSVYGSACLTGVFWLALQMFRVVLRFQQSETKK